MSWSISVVNNQAIIQLSVESGAAYRAVAGAVRAETAAETAVENANAAIAAKVATEILAGQVQINATNAATSASNAAISAAAAAQSTADTANANIATNRESNQILFDRDYITGINDSTRSGNITFDFTAAKLGKCTLMKHLDGGAFTFPPESILMFDSTFISTTTPNFYMFLIVKITSTEIVQIFHAMEGGVL